MSNLCVADFNGPVQVSGVNYVTAKSEAQLMAAIALGPTSITIDAESDVFYFYKTGVIADESCGTKLDHAVTAVGYGTDESSGLDYYLVRNSWGSSWGDNGYLKIKRGPDGEWGTCGI
jgi:cathepsin L